MRTVRTLPVAFFLMMSLVAACSDSPINDTNDTIISFDGMLLTDLGTPVDAVPSIDTSEVDASTDLASGCDEFGCPCVSNADCIDELCIEGVDGHICTKPCVAECPDGYDCVNTAVLGSDPISICVPRHIRLCRPCNTHDECADPFALKPGLCIPGKLPTTGSFCGSSCEFGLECPAGYNCSEVSNDEGVVTSQCLPENGSCECRNSWMDLNLSTTCSIENQHGLCEGERACSVNGLTGCSAVAPSAEVCNGIDDNCDGTTDELADSPCTETNEWGNCDGLMICGNGETTVCGAPTPAQETCNGLDDDCDGVLDEGTCNDGLACTVDACTADGACLNTPNEGSCLIEGACFTGGDTNPMDPCLACNPAQNVGSWTSLEGGSCNDGDPCTKADTCAEGQCFGTAYVCNDGLNCTGDQCDGNGECKHPIVDGYCTVEGLCWAEGQFSPANTCKFCKPAQTNIAWSNALSGLDCDDGENCTLNDKCSPGGSCSGTYQSCDDGKWCTADICDGNGGCSHTPEGGCLIDGKCFNSGAANPANPCETCSPNLTTNAWSPDNGKGCTDGNACTKADTCQAGACLGVAYSCSDDLGCTTDICDGAGDCSHSVDSGKCLIGGLCYGVGNPNPNNNCEFCSNAQKKSWADNDGVACSDGSACTHNDTCVGGTCQADYVVDNYETNDTKNSAWNLGSVKDNEEWPKGSFTATLHGPGDVDWYTFYDEDVWNGSIYPRVDIENIPVGSNYKLCAYYECSGLSMECKTGTSSSYAGMLGCCSDAAANGSEKVRLSPNCDGWSDDGNVFVRVTRVSGPWTCDAYTLKWGDD